MDGGVSVINAEAESGFADSKPKRIDYYSQLFTFKPNINETSRRMSENIASDFLTRQKLFIEKQKKHLEEAAGHYRAFPSPVKYTYKAAIDHERVSKSHAESSVESAEPQPQAFFTPRLPSQAKRSSTGALLRRSRTLPFRVSADSEPIAEDEPASVSVAPKRTPTKHKATVPATNDRLLQAKQQVDEAIKNGKVFSIIGPYPQIRRAMRKRGWVERFSERSTSQPQQRSPRSHSPKRKPGFSDGDDDGDDFDDNDGLDDEIDTEEEKVPPWEEDGGIYGMMSRMLRDIPPQFIWSLRKDQVDFRFLRKEQMVNHHSKTGTFTTKLGLCTSLRQLPWYDNEDSDFFYPRAYLITTDEDRQAFVEDFRITACANILKLLIQQYDDMEAARLQQEQEALEQEADKTRAASAAKSRAASAKSTRSRTVTFDSSVSGKATVQKTGREAEEKEPESENNLRGKLSKEKSKLQPKPPAIAIPVRAVDIALTQCRRYLCCRSNDDIDDLEDRSLSDSEWDQLLKWSYDYSHKNGIVQCTRALAEECRSVASELREIHCQFDMDGTKNVWICKPGAKSRGRDIKCFDTLKEIISYTIGSGGVAGARETYVVQKYIENPLLVYNTKFDIRQWFLVTDWNPLTVHWYQDCYLRFCSQPFSLENYDESVHLSNNSIQCKYTNAPSRSHKLPAENMWYSWQFDDYLRGLGCGSIWQQKILPQMKAAVLKTLYCVQDMIEIRKNCFEMFGADFMISDDFHVHLIEINSAPCLAPSTSVTADLVEQVVDDLLKVILDRRADRNCDIGRWDQICRMPLIAPPPYLGLQLVIEGHEVRKPIESLQLIGRASEAGVRPVQGELSSTRRSFSVNNLAVATSSRLTTAGNNNSSSLPKNNKKTGGSPAIEKERLQTRLASIGNAGKPLSSSVPPSSDDQPNSAASVTSSINMLSNVSASLSKAVVLVGGNSMPARPSPYLRNQLQNAYKKISTNWQTARLVPDSVPSKPKNARTGATLTSKSVEKALNDSEFRMEITKIRNLNQGVLSRGPPRVDSDLPSLPEEPSRILPDLVRPDETCRPHEK